MAIRFRYKIRGTKNYKLIKKEEFTLYKRGDMVGSCSKDRNHVASVRKNALVGRLTVDGEASSSH